MFIVFHILYRTTQFQFHRNVNLLFLKNHYLCLIDKLDFLYNIQIYITCIIYNCVWFMMWTVSHSRYHYFSSVFAIFLCIVFMHRLGVVCVRRVLEYFDQSKSFALFTLSPILASRQLVFVLTRKLLKLSVSPSRIITATHKSYVYVFTHAYIHTYHLSDYICNLCIINKVIPAYNVYDEVVVTVASIYICVMFLCVRTCVRLRSHARIRTHSILRILTRGSRPLLFVIIFSR